jgi:calcineurin-like phosphoesterase family protein
MKTWIVSDTHFGHINIVKYEPSRLSWGSTWEETTRVMLEAWARVVKPEDRVIHCGDFAMGLPENMPKYRASLPGSILLIRGNHDKKPSLWLTPRDTVVDQWEWDHPTFGLMVFRHDPHHFTLEEAEKATYLVHGHLHSNPYREDTPREIRAKCVCVSIERIPTRPGPLPFEEVVFLPQGK